MFCLPEPKPLGFSCSEGCCLEMTHAVCSVPDWPAASSDASEDSQSLSMVFPHCPMDIQLGVKLRVLAGFQKLAYLLMSQVRQCLASPSRELHAAPCWRSDGLAEAQLIDLECAGVAQLRLELGLISSLRWVM